MKNEENTMQDFDPKALQGFAVAVANSQQYKMKHLQCWIIAGDIKSQSELVKAAAIEASSKTCFYVQDWAASTKKFSH